MIDDGVPTKSSLDQDEVEAETDEIYEPLVDQIAASGADAVRLRRFRHARFVAGGLGVLSPGHKRLEASRPWILYWCLHSLRLLGSPVPREPGVHTIIEFLAACQSPEGGFGGGPGQCAHLATTYAAVAALVSLGGPEALAAVDRRALARFLLARAVPAARGGGATLHEGGEADVRGLYCALATARLARLDTRALGRALSAPAYLSGCFAPEGGAGGEPGNEAHGGYAFCALAAAVLAEGVGEEELLVGARGAGWGGAGASGAARWGGVRGGEGEARALGSSVGSDGRAPPPELPPRETAPARATFPSRATAAAPGPLSGALRDSATPGLDLGRPRWAAIAVPAAPGDAAPGVPPPAPSPPAPLPPLALIDLEALRAWAVAQQATFEGGFAGRTGKLADGCYSFWQGGTARILDEIWATGAGGAGRSAKRHPPRLSAAALAAADLLAEEVLAPGPPDSRAMPRPLAECAPEREAERTLADRRDEAERAKREVDSIRERLGALRVKRGGKTEADDGTGETGATEAAEEAEAAGEAEEAEARLEWELREADLGLAQRREAVDRVEAWAESLQRRAGKLAVEVERTPGLTDQSGIEVEEGVAARGEGIGAALAWAGAGDGARARQGEGRLDLSSGATGTPGGGPAGSGRWQGGRSTIPVPSPSRSPFTVGNDTALAGTGFAAGPLAGGVGGDAARARGAGSGASGFAPRGGPSPGSPRLAGPDLARAPVEPSYDTLSLQLWILAACQGRKGGLRDKPGTLPDYYHTCYCLSGLSAAQQYGPCLGGEVNRVEKTDLLLNVLADAADAAWDWYTLQDARDGPFDGPEAVLFLPPSPAIC